MISLLYTAKSMFPHQKYWSVPTKVRWVSIKELKFNVNPVYTITNPEYKYPKSTRKKHFQFHCKFIVFLVNWKTNKKYNN